MHTKARLSQLGHARERSFATKRRVACAPSDQTSNGRIPSSLDRLPVGKLARQAWSAKWQWHASTRCLLSFGLLRHRGTLTKRATIRPPKVSHTHLRPNDQRG